MGKLTREALTLDRSRKGGMEVHMEKVLKIGIIGCGGIANSKHMPSLSKLEGVLLTAFCDIEIGKAETAAKKYGADGAQVFSDYKELLKLSDIDVVHVCTPNLTHSDITVDALEAGKHVMCEKPMAVTAVEAKRMLDAAKRTGKKLTIGYQNRCRPDSIYMKEEAKKGAFGEIYYAKATALRRRAVPTWGVFQDDKWKSGPLFDIGTHALDLSLWMMDNYRPKYCVGTMYHKLNRDTDQGNIWGDWDPEKYTAEDSAFGFVVMENGATVTLEASWALNILDAREAITTVCGTKAGADMRDGLRINGICNNRQYITKPGLDGGDIAFIKAFPEEKPADREARLWIDAIRNGTDPVTLPEQAYCVTRILEGIRISAETGAPYFFPED